MHICESVGRGESSQGNRKAVIRKLTVSKPVRPVLKKKYVICNANMQYGMRHLNFTCEG